MLEINESIVINAPVDEVWRALAKLDDVQEFFESVTRSEYATTQRAGVGAARSCDVKGFGTLLETITDWRESETLTYRVEGMPPIVKHAQSKWRVVPTAPARTEVSVTSTIQTRFGFIGGMIETFAMRPQLTGLLQDALASFKDHVEAGRAPTTQAAQTLHASIA